MIIISEHVKAHLSRDGVFKNLIGDLDAKYTRASQGPFIDLVRIVIGQQVSVAAARSIYGRLTDQIGRNYRPNDILSLDEDSMKACGISRQKRGYIMNIGNYFQEHHEAIKKWDTRSDEEIIEHLTSIKGVGEWTAQMMLIFTFRRPDVFASKDVAIQNAMKSVYDLSAEGKELTLKMEDIAESWRPYRSVACLYLWNFLLKQRK